jgi:hypothetical protein
MPAEFSFFTNALTCFVIEFLVLATLITIFVLAHYHRAWRVRREQVESAPSANKSALSR